MATTPGLPNQYVWQVPVLSLIGFAIMEFVWLSSMAGFYQRQFGILQPRAQSSGMLKSLPAAVGAYVVLAGAIYLFILHPIAARWVRTRRQFLYAGLQAGALGLAIYGVYNLTNMATLRGYALTTVIVDTCWGATVMLATFGIAWACSRLFAREKKGQ